VRITLGSEPQNKQLLSTLHEVLREIGAIPQAVHP